MKSLDANNLQEVMRQSEHASKYLEEEYSYSNCGKWTDRKLTLKGGAQLCSRRQLAGQSKSLSPHEAFDQLFLRQTTRPEEVTWKKDVRVADLFCGCGGLSLGAKEACLALGYRFISALAIDNDTPSLRVYEDNFAPSNFYGRNIGKLIDGHFGEEPTSQEKKLVNEVGKIELLLAGPPCQGHSNLNNHTRRDDSRNKLYERVGRFAEIAEPDYIIVENVPEVVYGSDRALKNTKKHLRVLKYELDSGVVDLSKLGVPQERKRHVLVASIDGRYSIDATIDKYEVPTRDVRWAIEDIEEEERDGIFFAPSNHREQNRRRIAYLHENDCYDLPNHLRPECHQNDDHSYKSMYGRMWYDKPAQTITSGYGSPGQGRFVHPTQHRTLTPHEAARLQFFPDFFDFSSVKKRSDLADMIGNAVPMKLSYVFCLEFLS